MKRALLAAIAATAAVLIPVHVFAGDTDHILVVDGVEYQSYKEAGGSIHWETPGPEPTSASFAERNQTWAPGDNGSEHLPCDYGIHWISNDNNLTISHCLEDPPSTTTTTTTTTSTSTTSTTQPATTSTSTTTTSTSVASTTLPGTSTSPPTTTIAPTTTVADSTSTSSPTTTTGQSTTTSPSVSTVPSQSTTPAPTQPSTTAATTMAPTTIPTRIPATGSDGDIVPYAIAALALGVFAVLAARRRA